MAALAGRLGVTPMALYRHVAGKSDILDGVVGLLLNEFELPPRASQAPYDQLEVLARNIRASARRHPSVFPLLLQRPAITADARRARETVYAALRDTGIPEAQIAQVERLVSTAVLGFAVSEVAGRFGHHRRSQLDADFTALLALLRTYIEAQRHPAAPTESVHGTGFLA
jgi:AcrR family transcriptional regulator